MGYASVPIFSFFAITGWARLKSEKDENRRQLTTDHGQVQVTPQERQRQEQHSGRVEHHTQDKKVDETLPASLNQTQYNW
jgi:hypothetical protein